MRKKKSVTDVGVRSTDETGFLTKMGECGVPERGRKCGMPERGRKEKKITT